MLRNDPLPIPTLKTTGHHRASWPPFQAEEHAAKMDFDKNLVVTTQWVEVLYTPIR
jgi:hypothetical protein